MLAFQSVSWQPASTTAPAKKTATKTKTKTTTVTTRGQQREFSVNNQTKDYAVALLALIIIQYLCCRNQQNPKNIEDYEPPKSHLRDVFFDHKSTKMGDRLNIGREVRELKLGSTFNPQNSQTAFHTIKYDFKPASVDLNRVATVDVGSNNQVTVTVPNLESSGVPHTVFKGNQRKYTKECLIIFDRKTGTVTLERLNHNIQVKKTRSEVQNKAPVIPPAPQKFENNTQRTSSKTRVSTGSRKNNIIGFVPRNSPMQQGSPSSYSSTHKSPQSAPGWNANNAQATLPSIPLIEVDDDMGMPSMSGAIGGTSSSTSTNNSAPLMSANTSASNNSDFHHQQPHQQQQPQTQYHNQNSIPHMNSNSIGNNASSATQLSSANIASSSLASAAAALEREICESGAALSCSSDSSSDSDSSGSGSDSDDSGDDAPPKQNHQQPNQFQNYANGSFPALLHDDLQLSESCSSDSDD